MGANAQTSVLDFTNGQVLTGPQMDISAGTGVPVFATTVTRDAAFGGANKVLAEGQTCYLESTDVVQYYDGAAWASVGTASKVVQMVNTQTGALATGTTITIFDDSIPQITEGDQYMTQVITPTNAANILKIDVVFMGASSDPENMIVALFVGSTANALAAFGSLQSADQSQVLMFSHNVVAGVTTALTFRVRAGGGGGTTTFNGRVGERRLGGVSASSITITEYTP